MTGTTNIYAIFWEPTGNVQTNYNSLIQRYFSDVNGTGLYKNNTQYHDPAGHYPSAERLAASWVDSTAYPESPLLDSDIQNEVSHAQQVNSWSSSIHNIFFVFLEANQNLCFDNSHSQCASNTFCAYHSFFGSNTIYAAMPYAASFQCDPQSSPNSNDADQTINVTSHEQMEAATDPLLNAWYDNSGNEIGDKCAWTFGNRSLDGGAANVQWYNNFYIVQQEWSNAIDGCTLAEAVYTGSNDGNIDAIDASNGTIFWQYQTGGAVSSSPTVANDIVYVGSKDQFVYALNAGTGELIWKTQTGGPISSSPTVASDTVYIGSNDGYLYALKATDGTILWHYNMGGAVSSSPTVANGIVYASSNNGFLDALNAGTGKLLWHYQVRNAVFSSPTVANKIVYAGTSDGFVYALDASKGRLLWRYQTGSAASLTPTVTRNVVYIGCSNGRMYALNANRGFLLWRYQAKSTISTQATVANGVVYFGSYDDNLYALNANKGSLTWRYLTQGHILSSPAVVSGAIYFGSDDHNLYALTANTGSLSWHYLAGAEVQSSPTLGLLSQLSIPAFQGGSTSIQAFDSVKSLKRTSKLTSLFT
jgi:outer membrane protein assembly factor BamB